MAFKMILFSFCFASVVSDRPIANDVVCDGVAKVTGNRLCTTCNFLTFGQEKFVDGYISYFCPLLVGSDDEKKYCCYDPMRKPFCCDAATYAFTGFLWILAIILAIYAVAKLLKFLTR